MISDSFMKQKIPVSLSLPSSLSQSHALLESSLPEEALPWVPFIFGDPGVVSQISSRLYYRPDWLPLGASEDGCYSECKTWQVYTGQEQQGNV